MEDPLALSLKKDFVLFLVDVRSFEGRLADECETIESLEVERVRLEEQRARLIRELEQNQERLVRSFSEERMLKLQACLDRAKNCR